MLFPLPARGRVIGAEGVVRGREREQSGDAAPVILGELQQRGVVRWNGPRSRTCSCGALRLSIVCPLAQVLFPH